MTAKKELRAKGAESVIDAESTRQARQADLAEYLMSIGEPLVKNGHRHRHKDHDSLIFTKNAYYWNSRSEHGNSIDYLIKHKGMSFESAVKALIGFTPSQAAADEAPLQLASFEISKDCKRAMAYLCKTRNIDYRIVKNLIDISHLYQEQTTNNIIFPIYDELNQCVGAELQGTLSNKRFKGIKTGSKYGYGFNVRFGEIFDYALFFESAVDLMSFIDLKNNHEKKSLERCILISMAGLKPNIVRHMAKLFGVNLRVVLCVDNDDAGENFKNAMKEIKIDFKVCQPKDKFKDWNNQLEFSKTT